MYGDWEYQHIKVELIQNEVYYNRKKGTTIKAMFRWCYQIEYHLSLYGLHINCLSEE